MQYQPGKEHMNANCFSRLPLPVTEAAGPEDRVLMIEELEDCSVLSAEISEWTRRDPVLAHVHEYPLRGWPSDDKSPDLAAYRVQKDELSVQDGCVLRGAQVVIPQQGPQQVMSELHAAYLGINRMKRLAGSYVCGLGWTVILRTWSVSVKNTSMGLSLHRYIRGSFQMVRGSEFMWTMLAPSKLKCFWGSSMPFPNGSKLPS